MRLQNILQRCRCFVIVDELNGKIYGSTGALYEWPVSIKLFIRNAQQLHYQAKIHIQKTDHIKKCNAVLRCV